MAFTDDQRAQIRLYMGMPRVFAQVNSILENVMSAIDNLSGPPPNGDNGATQARIVTVLAQIDAINTQIVQNAQLMLATEVMDEVKFDAIRNDAGLRRVGRALIQQLSIPLSMKPAVDFFSSAGLNPTPDINMHQFD
jgi:hypothetical protein